MAVRRRILNTLLGATALFAAATGHVYADTLEEGFSSPPMEVRPRVRWWWPGADVTDEEVRRELHLLADNGFAGAEVQAMTPNFVALSRAERDRVNQYAEPMFFDRLKAAGEAAKSLGMSLDYTLGSAWPPGGGFAITPEKALSELSMAVTQVKGGEQGPIKVTIPKWTRRLGALSFFDERTKDPKVADWAARLDARARIVAVVAMKGSAPETIAAQSSSGFKLSPWSNVRVPGELDPASGIVLTDKIAADGTLQWSPPPGDWQVFVFKQYAVDMGVLGAAGQGPQLVLDPTDPDAFRRHAARTGDPLGIDPAGIRSTFIDSFELMQDIHWGPEFLDQFRKRRGYDLTPYLPFILQPGWMQAWDERYSPPYFNAKSGDLADRVRADYRRTLSESLMTGFVKPFVDWNHSHGMLAKLQAHGGPFDIIQAYGSADIPETEDLVHGADPLFMRLARSAAHLYGRKHVSVEGLAWGGRPFDVTPDDMRRRVDLIIAGGVTDIIMHGMNYRYKAEDWPGWHAFSPNPSGLSFSSMLNETNPIWPAMKPLAHYVARLQSVMQSGDAIVPVAYYYGRYGYYVGIEDGGAGKQAAEKTFIAGGYDFDRINPDSIARARVEDRQLVAAGGARYSVLVLPPISAMRAETAEAIARFAKAGLPVFFTDHIPDRDEGLADAARRDKRVRRAIDMAMKAGAKMVSADNVVPSLRQAGVAANLTFGGDASDLVFVQRNVGDRLVTFLANVGTSARDVNLTLPRVGGVTRWNAIDGSIAPYSASASGNATQVPLNLPAGQSALLVLDSREAPHRVDDPATQESMTLPVDGWNLNVQGHAMRKPYAHDLGTIALGDWRNVPELANFAGEGTYRRTVAIDGQLLGRGRKLFLELGEVHDMATVTLNGRTLPPAITRPFRIDITGVAKPGNNDLIVTVANVLENAMVDPKSPSYKSLRPVPAGLVGPLRIVAQ
ncbi:hypothetical protein J3E64_003831 [Sphingobium sp. OAS761]|uniref:glycosyl hydrolase n=1 Tax=Sphingobium sp. OAS761 TaxID=2817901 RepID=UPI00209D32A1|nr:glycosyl hydrolase [Sphingobium sp. OAS761]MCP1472116.1 hypothetical protein [Sphingobium sp. OAS761]